MQITLIALVGCVAPGTPGGSGTASTGGTGDTAAAVTGDTGDPAPLCAAIPRDREESAPGPADLAGSLVLWQAQKAVEGDDYAMVDVYDGYHSSHTTVTVVTDDVVVERCRFDRGGPGEDWVETGADVGTHPEPVLTMEQVYAGCEADIVPLDPAAYAYVNVDYHAEGMLRHCVAFPLDCYDDCESGYRVSAFTWL